MGTGTQGNENTGKENGRRLGVLTYLQEANMSGGADSVCTHCLGVAHVRRRLTASLCQNLDQRMRTHTLTVIIATAPRRNGQCGVV